MHYIVIDDNNKFAEELLNKLSPDDNVHFHQFGDTTTSQIAQHIIVSFPTVIEFKKDNNTDNNGQSKAIIFINIEGEFEKANRQDQKGVEVLLWLRCKHKVCNPVILYSFQSNAELLRKKPEHLVINSEGCYHYQLPLITENIIERLNLKHFNKITNWSNLRYFLKSSIDIDRIKHNSANIIGMIYLSTFLKKTLSINEDNTSINIIDDYKSTLEYSILETYYSLSEIEISEEQLQDVNNKRNELINNDPRIIFVDDLANSGWGQLFKIALYYNVALPKFKISNCLNNANEDDIINSLITEIKEHKPVLVLLDLKLINQSNQTGFNLLKNIKNQYPGLSVIITSATNNGRTIKELYEFGADAVWTKPGLSENLDGKELATRFVDLYHQVYKVIFKFKNVQVGDMIKSREKLLWTKYRLDLYDNDYSSLNLNSIKIYDYIYIDTNILISQNANIVDTISNIYKLAKITIKQNVAWTYSYKNIVNQKIIIDTIDEVNIPRVIIMNQIIDELISKTKDINFNKNPEATYAYNIIISMIKENIISTEITGVRNNNNNIELVRKLFPPKEGVYADGFLLDELTSIFWLKYKHLKYFHNVENRIRLNFDINRILIVTSDRGLQRKCNKIDSTKITVWNEMKFNTQLNLIAL